MYIRERKSNKIARVAPCSWKSETVRQFANCKSTVLLLVAWYYWFEHKSNPPSFVLFESVWFWKRVNPLSACLQYTENENFSVLQCHALFSNLTRCATVARCHCSPLRVLWIWYVDLAIRGPTLSCCYTTNRTGTGYLRQPCNQIKDLMYNTVAL